MSKQDDGTSKCEYSFINQSGSLNNRLGALYSCIYKFINIRLSNGCKDTVSAVMTPGYLKKGDGDSCAVIAAKRVIADENFVKDYLLKYLPRWNENYGAAFKSADTLIDKSEETVVIFLCDGISADNGAAAIAKNLKAQMNEKFSLFCLTLGPGTYNNNEVVKNICSSGGGIMKSTLSGNELGATFTQIAKQMNTGTFARL